MLHILIVDEQPEILEIASIYLEKYGDYSIDEAYSATEALSKLHAESYDAIVSDYEMPEMDGLTFLKEVRKINQSVPFIIFSGKGREQVVTEAFRSGADGYVQKGKDPKTQFAELNHQINIAFKRRYAESELRMKEYAIEASFNGIFMFDEHNKVSYINNAGLKLHGYSKKCEIIGKGITDLFEISQGDAQDEDIFPSLSEKGWYFGEIKGLKEDKSEFDVQLCVVHIKNEITGDTYCFGSYIDITEKKMAEKALLEFITEAALRLKEPVNHICLNLAETIDTLDTANPDVLKMKLSVQLKNAQQVIKNLNELNTAISNGFDSIPDESREFLIR